MTTFGKECMSLYLWYENQNTWQHTEIVRRYWINEGGSTCIRKHELIGHSKEEQRKVQNKEQEW